jgi:hypothetical protein
MRGVPNTYERYIQVGAFLFCTGSPAAWLVGAVGT